MLNAPDGRSSRETVSFVIPVRNDADRLRRCLNTIRANDYPDSLLEIVVVDNGSEDNSPDVARAARAHVIVCPEMSVSELRNRGAAASSGEILAFVDADHEIVPEWIRYAVQTLRTAGAGAVGAACRAPIDGTWVQKTYDLLRQRHAGVKEVDWLGSGNMAVPRWTFESVRGFDVGLQTCEDVDLCRRIRALGQHVLHDARLGNIHLGDPASLLDLFRGELWRGRDNIRAAFRGSVRLRDVPSVAIPLIELGLMALALGGLATFTAAGWWLALLALAGILCTIGARTVRMLAQSDRITARLCGQAFMVAAVYDLARALSLIRPAGHDERRKTS